MRLAILLLAFVLCCALGAPAQAALLWGYRLNSPIAPVGPTDRVYGSMTFTNSALSTENLKLASYGYGAGYPLEYGSLDFGRDQPFPWSAFTSEFQGVDLAPGTSKTLDFVTVIPINGPVGTGDYEAPVALFPADGSDLRSTLNWTVIDAGPDELFGASIDALKANYAPPTPDTSAEELAAFQQSAYLTAEAAGYYADAFGQPYSGNFGTDEFLELLEVADGLRELFTVFLNGRVPHPFFFILEDTLCTTPLQCVPHMLPDSGKIIRAPSGPVPTIAVASRSGLDGEDAFVDYEAFEYILPLHVDEADTDLFRVGDRFVLDQTVRPKTTGFSAFEVQGVEGNLVTLRARDFSILQTAVPEPATWAMMVLGLGGIGAVFRQAASTARRKSCGVAI